VGDDAGAGDAEATGDALAEPDGDAAGEADALGEPDAAGETNGAGDEEPPPLHAARDATKTHHHMGRIRAAYGNARAVPLNARPENRHTSSASPPR
jgi:hypothetical protein